jgi:hypothetical protein
MCDGKPVAESSIMLSHGCGKWKMHTIARAQKPIIAPAPDRHRGGLRLATFSSMTRRRSG